MVVVFFRHLLPPFTLTGPKFAYKFSRRTARILFPHQREEMQWLWSFYCQRKGGILGDDMRLVKTIQGHLIEIPSTQRAKSSLEIPSSHCSIIRGEPQQNHLKESWGLFKFGCPGIIGDKYCFKEKYESAILGGRKNNSSNRYKCFGSAVVQVIFFRHYCSSHHHDFSTFTLTGPKSTFKLPHRIAHKLYPHHREGLKWLWSLHCQGTGGILADDMDLRKTMQICGYLAGLFHSRLIKRVLIVSLNETLISHWKKELTAVGLSAKTREYFGTCAKAQQYELEYILQDKLVLLTTYDTVRRNVKSLCGDFHFTWDYMILDEGHLIKNPSTKRSKSLRKIPAAHRIILTGTPLQNNLKELWALFNFCCPGLLGDKNCFKKKYESPILRGNKKNVSDKVNRVGSAAAQELRSRIQPHFLRRESTAKLPKKYEIVVWLRLTGVQRRLYEAYLKSKIVFSAFNDSPLAALTILKKICNHPLHLTKGDAKDVLEGMESDLNKDEHSVAEKLANYIADVSERFDCVENHDDFSCKISFILSLLDNLIPDGHYILIFSQTREMLNLIQDSLMTSRGYPFLRIDGTTKAADRRKIVNDFQEGNGASILLLTSRVDCRGLTLTKADRIIIIDPSWNPRTDNQCVDPAYKNGQTKNVIVYRLMTCGTVEEKIYRKQIFKGGLLKSATEHKEHICYFSQQAVEKRSKECAAVERVAH